MNDDPSFYCVISKIKSLRIFKHNIKKISMLELKGMTSLKVDGNYPFVGVGDNRGF